MLKDKMEMIKQMNMSKIIKNIANDLEMYKNGAEAAE
jgi:hypothetical protein